MRSPFSSTVLSPSPPSELASTVSVSVTAASVLALGGASELSVPTDAPSLRGALSPPVVAKGLVCELGAESVLGVGATVVVVGPAGGVIAVVGPGLVLAGPGCVVVSVAEVVASASVEAAGPELPVEHEPTAAVSNHSAKLRDPRRGDAWRMVAKRIGQTCVDTPRSDD